MCRTCSTKKDFKGHVDRMKEWFLAGGYLENVIKEQVNKVGLDKIQSSRKNSENGIPFLVSYYPKVKKLGKLIKDLLPFLYSDEEVQKVYLLPPMASHKSARKIKDLIFRSKLYPHEINVGCGGCGNGRCQVFKNREALLIHLTVLLLKKVTKSTINLTAMISASSTSLVYLFDPPLDLLQ